MTEKTDKFVDLKEKSLPELEELAVGIRLAMSRFRGEISLGDVKKIAGLKQHRRKLARILTLKRQKQLVADSGRVQDA